MKKLAAAVALVALVACAHLTPNERRLISCGGSIAAEVLAEVGRILAGDDADWPAALDRAVAKSGDVALCAIRVVGDIAAAGKAPPPMSALDVGGPTTDRRTVRADAYLEANRVAFERK